MKGNNIKKKEQNGEKLATCILVKQFCNDWIIFKHNIHTYFIIIILNQI